MIQTVSGTFPGYLNVHLVPVTYLGESYTLHVGTVNEPGSPVNGELCAFRINGRSPWRFEAQARNRLCKDAIYALDRHLNPSEI